MIARFLDKHLFIIGLGLAAAFVLSEMVKQDTVPFRELDLGEQYWEAHERLGYKLFTKVDANVASAFRQTCSGRKHNDFVIVRDDHRVTKAGRWEE